MKKLVFVAIMAIFMLSCSTETEVETVSNPLIGTWQESETGGDIEICTYIFKADLTGQFLSKVNGTLVNDVKFNYTFDQTKMELNVMWINAPAWDNDKVVIDIRNGNVLVWRADTYYKK